MSERFETIFMEFKNLYQCKDVFAIVVTYNPDIVVLGKLLDSLLPQVGRAVIIDNCSSAAIENFIQKSKYQNLEFFRLDKNYGIAHAQNVGISKADINSTKFFLLSDQDSKPAKDMVAELRKAAIILIDSGRKVAALGPYFTDVRQNNPSPFSRIEGLSLKRQHAEKQGNIVEVDHVIASGCLIPISALDSVGLMNSDLFIDYVDIEWCIRAKSRGFQSFGVFSSTMNHSLGDEHVNFMGRKITLHSPLRHYYLVRNGFWLYKQKNIPFNWKLVDGCRMLLRMCFYSIFAKPRGRHVKMMLKGLLHGLYSRLGPY